MKEIWVNADPWQKEMVMAAIECGADAVLVPGERVEEVQSLGLINTVSDKGDIQWDRDVFRTEIMSNEDEDRIVELSLRHKVLVSTPDWHIIPLENLVSRGGNIFIEVKDEEGALTAAGILERGVNGIVINNDRPDEVRGIVNRLRASAGHIGLSEAVVESVTAIGMGDRVCVDTCSSMSKGQGMLVGNSSNALFLVHSESMENPYVAARPFRVNAGAVHAYIMTPGDRTRYLSELKAGDELMTVDFEGKTFPTMVGRIKIERRPMLLIKARDQGGGLITSILQNAETVRLVEPGGNPVSAISLEPGQKVLIAASEGARHFGRRIEETFSEG